MSTYIDRGPLGSHFHRLNRHIQHQPSACSALSITNGIRLVDHGPFGQRFVVKHGFKLPFRGATLRELALEALKISGQGLARRNRLNSSGASEAVFLEPLLEFALANETPAERKLALFHGEWNGSVDPVFREFAY